MTGINQIPNTSDWAQQAGSHLRAIIEEIETAPAPEFIGQLNMPFSRLATEARPAIENLTKDERIERDRCVYIISLDDVADPEEVSEAFKYAKANLSYALPKHNKSHSRTLYVGSSCATGKRKNTMRMRLQQHLLGTSKVTSALSLAKWTSTLAGGVTVSVWQYPSFGDDTEGDQAARRIVLAIEDWLSHKLKPMLGRRGSQN